MIVRRTITFIICFYRYPRYIVYLYIGTFLLFVVGFLTSKAFKNWRIFHVTPFQWQPPEVYCKKGVLRNIPKFTGKHVCQSLLRPATLLKKRLWHRCFPMKFAKFLRTTFFTEHLWWLLLQNDMN